MKMGERAPQLLAGYPGPAAMAFSSTYGDEAQALIDGRRPVSACHPSTAGPSSSAICIRRAGSVQAAR